MESKKRPITLRPKWQQVRATPRPQIPLLMWLLVALLAGELIAASTAHAIWLAGALPTLRSLLTSLGRTPVFLESVGGLAAAAFIAGVLRRRAVLRLCLIMLLMLICGAALGATGYEGLFARMRSASPAHYQQLRVRLIDDPRTSLYGTTVSARVIAGRLRGMRLQLSSSGSMDLEQGHELTLKGVPRALEPDEKRVFLLDQGVVASMSLTRAGPATWQKGPLGTLLRFRAEVARQIRATKTSFPVSDELRGFFCGTLLGDRRGFEGSELQAVLQRTGLIHLLSISGSHLALLAALTYFALRRTRLSRRRSVLAACAVAGLYTLLTGCAPTTLRALGMLVCGSLALLLRRRSDLLSALSLSITTMLLVDPLLATSLSVQLSLASVAGISLFGGYFGRWLRCLLPRPGKLVAQGFGMTIAASLAILPFSAGVFGVVSLVAPLTNLLLAPLVMGMLVVGLCGVICSLVSPVLAQACFRGALTIGVVFERMAGWFSQLGWAAVTTSALPAAAIICLCGGVVALWVFWIRPTPQRAHRLGAAALAVVVLVSATPLARPGTGRLTRGVVVLDVGQGDALLVRDAGHAGLIDTGPSATALQSQLHKFKVTRLDFVLFTHGHADHVGGASALDRSFHITRIYVSQGAQRSAQLLAVSARLGAPLTGLRAGQSFLLGQIRITAIWPRAEISDADANESCLTTLLTDESPDDQDPVATDTLLTSGDAEAATVSSAVAAARITHVDVLKVPHHGSKVALSDALLDRLTPTLAVISCGLHNSYGHPRPETLAFLRKHAFHEKRTDLDGPVLVPF